MTRFCPAFVSGESSGKSILTCFVKEREGEKDAHFLTEPSALQSSLSVARKLFFSHTHRHTLHPITVVGRDGCETEQNRPSLSMLTTCT